MSSAQLSKALCEPLAQGARLHCLVDAAGSAVFTLPCHSFSRKDGWQDWEACRPILLPAICMWGAFHMNQTEGRRALQD